MTFPFCDAPHFAPVIDWHLDWHVLGVSLIVSSWQYQEEVDHEVWRLQVLGLSTIAGGGCGICWGRENQKQDRKWWIEKRREKCFTVAMASNVCQIHLYNLVFLMRLFSVTSGLSFQAFINHIFTVLLLKV